MGDGAYLADFSIDIRISLENRHKKNT